MLERIRAKSLIFVTFVIRAFRSEALLKYIKKVLIEHFGIVSVLPGIGSDKAWRQVWEDLDSNGPGPPKKGRQRPQCGWF